MNCNNNVDTYVSIIMPTYNDQQYIFESISSVLNQTFKNWELIIIDDCSADETLNIVKSFNDRRIKIFENEVNRGAAFSRNKGISIARGEYIAFLDGDDLWLPNKLENQIAFMKTNNINFSATYYYESINGICKKIIKCPKSISHKKFLRYCPIGCLTVVYKKEIYEHLSIPIEIKKRNDYALWIKLSEKSPCVVLDEPTAIYCKRENSISSGKKSALFKYHYKLWKTLYNYGNSKAFYYSFRNVIYYFYKKIVYANKLK